MRGHGVAEYALDIQSWYDGAARSDQPVGKFRFNLESLKDLGAVTVNEENKYVFKITKNHDGTLVLVLK